MCEPQPTRHVVKVYTAYDDVLLPPPHPPTPPSLSILPGRPPAGAPRGPASPPKSPRPEKVFFLWGACKKTRAVHMGSVSECRSSHTQKNTLGGLFFFFFFLFLVVERKKIYYEQMIGHEQRVFFLPSYIVNSNRTLKIIVNDRDTSSRCSFVSSYLAHHVLHPGDALLHRQVRPAL